jgi:hypothetical protein
MARQKRSVEGEFDIFVGVDWGTEFHRACVLNARGEILRGCRIDHNGEAMTEFLRSLQQLTNGGPSRIAVAIEVPRGPVVEAFLEGGQPIRERRRNLVGACSRQQRSLFHIVSGVVRGTDHFLPGIAVDKAGTLGVCWYDRRFDPLNFMISRACATSSNGGTSWNTFFTSANWAPFHATDAFTNPFYLGDCDTVASDISMTNTGFLGAYGNVNTGPGILVPNQDVLMFVFP